MLSFRSQGVIPGNLAAKTPLKTLSVFAFNLTVKMFQDRELLPDRELAQKSFSHVDSENLACTRIAAETDRGAEGGNRNLGVDPPSAPPIRFPILATFGPTQTKSPEAS